MQDIVSRFGFDPSINVSDIGINTLWFYVQAAQKLGISYKLISKGNIVEFSKDEKRFLIKKAILPITNYTAADIAGRKKQSNLVLSYYGLPVPRSAKAETLEDLVSIFRSFDSSVVVKPDTGIGGKGVTILPTESELNSAWEYSNKYKNVGSVIVEEFIKGDNYRLLVLGDKVIAAAKRHPAHVIGNGLNSVAELINIQNKEREKVGLAKIVLDSEALRRLNSENRNEDTTPQTGEVVYLRYNCNLSLGGTTEECLSSVHPEYLATAVKACKAIGLELGGLDLITPDISNPNSKFAINEINRAPGLRIHYYPDKGEPVNVAETILKYTLEKI
ncbi:ATP-grasp domain-containing protein [Candidatus Dojkabacteria bacterium]|nr:ATP-grasp domain-containing protein [Candidatus Dojkabacteria bacterium]